VQTRRKEEMGNSHYWSPNNKTIDIELMRINDNHDWFHGCILMILSRVW
jgi:hypothetical protein